MVPVMLSKMEMQMAIKPAMVMEKIKKKITLYRKKESNKKGKVQRKEEKRL